MACQVGHSMAITSFTRLADDTWEVASAPYARAARGSESSLRSMRQSDRPGRIFFKTLFYIS
jgi:hypothetical protein